MLQLPTTMGNVRLTHLIGRGGMASVYLGIHETLNVAVAVKLINAGLADDASILGRFAQEAQILASLNHPNIVRILDFVQGDHPYIVQEYVDGLNLLNYCNGKPLAEQEAIRITIEVANALRAAHSKGIVHKDVKPSNVFIADNGRIMLGDFGISQINGQDPFTEVGNFTGTPGYMAPEVILGKFADHRSDIFSLGVSVYEMVFGHTPPEHDGVSFAEQFINITKNVVEVPPGITEPFAIVLRGMLQREPQDRIQSAEELLAHLMRIFDPLLGVEIHNVRLLRSLGKGGQGHVYLAQSGETLLAVKLLLTHDSVTTQSRERFRLEGKVSKSLEHPNIVAVHDHGETVVQVRGESRVFNYIVMEFVDGMDLEDWICRSPNPDWKMSCSIVLKVLGALSYAHSSGVVHRDVKARNVMISKDGEVLLTDFGLCKFTSDYNPKTSFSFSGLTASGDIMGSPHFMSPEQIRLPSEVDCRTDIYSCGVLLFYLCTHKLPFSGTTPMSILMSIVADPLVDPRSLNPDLPREIVAIIRTMMQKDPGRRYASCVEAASDLTYAIESNLIEKIPVGQLIISDHGSSRMEAKSSITTTGAHVDQVTKVRLIVMAEPSIDDSTTRIR